MDKPVSMQWELTWGCNRRCWFCGIHDIPFGEFRHMSLQLVEKIVEELGGWRPGIRLEFGTGGEPSLNPDLFAIVEAAKTIQDIQVMIQTNCEPWCLVEKEWSDQAAEIWIRQWFKAGGDFLVLNCYKDGLADHFNNLLPSLGFPWVDFYSNPERVSMYHNQHGKKKYIFLCKDLGLATSDGTTKDHAQRWFNNQGGSTPGHAYSRLGRPIPKLPLAKRCTYPFRQMVINWDGKVPLCCYDWTDRLIAGTFPDQSLQSIWESRTMQIARQLLYRKNRQMLPCSTCDLNGGFRVGLLKDPGLVESDDELLSELRVITESQKADWQDFQKMALTKQEKDYAPTS